MIGETITDTLMNTLPKSLTVAFLAVFIFISGFNVDPVGAQNTAAGTAASRSPADFLQSRYLRFGRLTAEDGLSGNQTYNVAQDNYGFVWFATSNGLSRYDGASIKVYRHDPDDPSSLGHNFIRSLIIDQSGVLWVGTWGGGLNQYDREKDAFIHYQHNPDNPHSLSNNVARTIYEDRNGTIWVGTHEGSTNSIVKKSNSRITCTTLMIPTA
jgi:ligand-binding sensor domain-containing protein